MSEILGIDTNNYAVQSLKSSGGGSATLQEKSVTITTNGTTNATPDSGYDGLSKVNITTNVQPNLQNKILSVTQNGTNTVIADTGYDGLNEVEVNVNVPAPQPSLQSRSVTITENGTTNVAPDTGYDGLSGVAITTNVSGGGDLSEYFNTSVKAGSQNTSGFARYSLKKIPENIVMDPTQSPTYVMGLFSYLQAITSVPYFDTTGSTSFRYFCTNCLELVDVPIYNTASVLGPYGMNNVFSSCPKLSDESLNNILKMCINAVSYDGTKTLTQLGLSSTQKTKCQSLSNWNDFVNAGWSA